MDFLDRTNDIKRINTALAREEKQFIVLYGRRRIGKSTIVEEFAKKEYSSYSCK